MAASLTSRLLTELLPPDLAASVRQHLLHPRAPLQIYKQEAWSRAQRALPSLQPYMKPVLDKTISLIVDNQGVTGVVVLLTVVTVMVVVMNWIRRLIMWWTRLMVRAMFWAGVVLALAWVWNRGVVESARDGVVFVSKAVGYLAVLKDFWMQEYERYEANGSRGRGTRGRSSGR